MTVLVLGLLLFLGVHSTRIIAEPWRTATLARLGEAKWKGAYSLVSLIGFVLIVWGYGLARNAPTILWPTPIWTRHLAALLTIVAFVLITAAYVPGTRIKAIVGHPMVLGVAVWALAHLIANGSLADLALFGSFLVWAVANFATARQRDRVAGTTYLAGPMTRDLTALAIGIVAWTVFALYLHGVLIGVRPLG